MQDSSRRCLRGDGDEGIAIGGVENGKDESGFRDFGSVSNPKDNIERRSLKAKDELERAGLDLV